MTEAPLEKHRWGWLASLRLAAAVVFLAAGALAVVRAPADPLWKLTIAVTEAGHIAALVCACLLIGGLRLWRSRAAFLAAVLATVLLASPLWRASLYAEEVGLLVEQAFPGAVPFEASNAGARVAPLQLGDVFKINPPEMPHSVLTYSPEKSLTLDLYTPTTPAPWPVVVFIHGGGWKNGDSAQLPALNSYLAARGIAVASVNYSKAPGAPFPAACDDIAAAIAYLKASAEGLGLDATRIVLAGRSAGAHLAMMAGYRGGDPAIRGIVGIYGPTDLVWSWENPANPLLYDSRETLRDFLGGPLEGKRQVYEAASPMRFVNAEVPETFLIHGARDGIVSLRQSERLAGRLREAGAAHTLLVLPWSTHGFDASLYGPSGQPFLYSLERFLGRVLRER